VELRCGARVAPPLRPGSVMSFFVYLLVLFVAAGSVLFGFDWLQSPLPSATLNRTMVATAPANAAKPIKAVRAKPTAEPAERLDAKLSPVYPATPNVPQSAEANASNDVAQARPVSRCDIDACARAYYTFRPFDCSYQPNSGPRRFCTKGNPPKPSTESVAAATRENEAHAQAVCNVAACERAYTSFNASDCTYQPFNGTRRLCTK